jgi:DNA-binding GntR family transcriptional regulator
VGRAPPTARRPRAAASAAPAPPDNRPSHVYEHLRTLIVRGQIAPGSRVVEVDVAARLGVSRTPVRAALQRLQQEGYVVFSPGLQQARPVVAPLTQGDAREVFHIVAELEGLAARGAAELASAPRRALVADMRALNDEFCVVAGAARPDHARLEQLDTQFHHRYVEAGAGPRLATLHASVKPQLERYERLYVSLLVSELPISVAEHEAIIRAVRAGDADGAQQAVRTNWRNAAERLAAVIERAGERGAW